MNKKSLRKTFMGVTVLGLFIGVTCGLILGDVTNVEASTEKSTNGLEYGGKTLSKDIEGPHHWDVIDKFIDRDNGTVIYVTSGWGSGGVSISTTCTDLKVDTKEVK